MFLCLCLTLAPLALPLVALAIAVLSAVSTPDYGAFADIPAPESAPVSADVAPVAPAIRVARYERPAYPFPVARCAVTVRYSGATSEALSIPCVL